MKNLRLTHTELTLLLDVLSDITSNICHEPISESNLHEETLVFDFSETDIECLKNIKTVVNKTLQ